MDKQKINKARPPRAIESVLGFLENMFIAMLVVSLIFVYFFRLVTIGGDSMSSTVCSGEKVVITASCRHPDPGDIIVFNADEAVTLDESRELVKKIGVRRNLIKRVIATGGQSVDIDFERGIVYVDGKQLDEPYTSGLTHMDMGSFTGKYPVTVPEGYVFVLGDNRRDSIDSRAREIGFVPVDDILGKVVFRISPLSRAGFVK